MAKKTNYVYDRETGRWRKNGKWAKAPKRSQLRADSLGRPIDAAGKRVPLGSIPVIAKKAPPKKKVAKRKQQPKAREPKQTKPAKKKKASKPAQKGRRKPARKGAQKKPKAPRKPEPKPRRGTKVIRSPRAPRAEVSHVPDGQPITSHELLSSTFVNARAPDKVAQVLSNLLVKKSEKVGLGPDDIHMYKFGVHFISTYGRTDVDEMEKLVSFFSREYPDFEFKYDSDALTVLLGSKDKPILRDGAVSALAERKKDFVEIYQYLDDLWDSDIGWFVIAENDEVAGGS